MTDDRLPLAELLAKAGNGDFLRNVAEAVLQMLMEADVEGLIGAGRLSKDYEALPEVSEAMVTLAAIRLMLHRLAHPNRRRLPAS
jgi:hypothetical protein